VRLAGGLNRKCSVVAPCLNQKRPRSAASEDLEWKTGFAGTSAPLLGKERGLSAVLA